LGGVTAVFEMPNTDPSTTTRAAIEDKLGRAAGRMHCDHAFYVGATPQNASELGTLERLPGVAGVKIFMGSSTGTLLVADDESLAAVLGAVRRRVAVHAEDEPRLRDRAGLRAVGDPASHPFWRDAETALRATQRVLTLARRLGRRVHVLHVSTGDEMDLLAGHKDIATVEVTPQHLTLADDAYARIGTRAQMNPPIRSAGERERLWRAVAAGIVDVVGSDHAPHTADEKARPYPESPSGMPGVQTLLPLLLDHCHASRLTLSRVVDLTSAGPGRVFGIAGKGRIAVGYDADLSICDLGARWTVTDEAMASRAGWTPFAGTTLTGRAVGTVIRGRRVMWDGEIVAPGTGAPLRFLEALAPSAT
jgi:dihydroorotase